MQKVPHLPRTALAWFAALCLGTVIGSGVMSIALKRDRVPDLCTTSTSCVRVPLTWVDFPVPYHAPVPAPKGHYKELMANGP